MKLAIITPTIALLMATQAQALSCMPPDIARAFHWAAESEDNYIVLNGAFSFDAPVRRERQVFDQETVSHEAAFDGRYLGAEGFVAAPSFDVTLAFVCLASWCGSIENNGDDMVVFAQQTTDGYVVEIDPCYSTVFPSNRENIMRVEACMRGEACEEVPF